VSDVPIYGCYKTQVDKASVDAAEKGKDLCLLKPGPKAECLPGVGKTAHLDILCTTFQKCAGNITDGSKKLEDIGASRNPFGQYIVPAKFDKSKELESLLAAQDRTIVNEKLRGDGSAYRTVRTVFFFPTAVGLLVAVWGLLSGVCNICLTEDAQKTNKWSISNPMI
jgi:hypothetical protein